MKTMAFLVVGGKTLINEMNKESCPHRVPPAEAPNKLEHENQELMKRIGKLNEARIFAIQKELEAQMAIDAVIRTLKTPKFDATMTAHTLMRASEILSATMEKLELRS